MLHAAWGFQDQEGLIRWYSGALDSDQDWALVYALRSGRVP
jgi:hypothetical protein